MNKQVNFYAIRIVGTDYFMINKNSTFGSFEEALNMGVFFYTRSKALFRIQEVMKVLKWPGDQPLGSGQYQIHIDGQWKRFTPRQEWADLVKDLYEITVRDIELEVVPLVMSIA